MLEFAWPWMLGLMPLPWLIKRNGKSCTIEQAIALKVPFFSELEKIAAVTTHTSTSSPLWLRYLIWGL